MLYLPERSSIPKLLFKKIKNISSLPKIWSATKETFSNKFSSKS